MSDRVEDKEKYFKGIIPPPIIFFALVLLGFAAHRLFPFKLMFPTWSTRLLLGMPLLAASGLIAVNALLIMRKNKTTVTFHTPTTKFVIQGPFRFTRNPLYLSLLLVMGSLIFLTNSGWHLLSFFLLFLFFNFGVVVREEKYLENSFGEEYMDYKKRVRRWL